MPFGLYKLLWLSKIKLINYLIDVQLVYQFKIEINHNVVLRKYAISINLRFSNYFLHLLLYIKQCEKRIFEFLLFNLILPGIDCTLGENWVTNPISAM